MSLAETQRGPTEQRLSRPVEGSAVPEIVAEISGNHGGLIENAFRLIDEAKRAGADAVKFQCFEPQALALKRIGVSWNGERMSYQQLVELYKKTHTPKLWFPALRARCTEVGIAWFSSVFSPGDVEFLEGINCPRYKISAYEMLDGDLINAVVATGKPIIMSVRQTERVTILEATDYEGRLEPLGLSDHAPLAFPRFKDRPMVERHLMLPNVQTEDGAFSSTPDEFAWYAEWLKS